MNLLLATDLRIVAEDARIMTGFARIGIHPGAATSRYSGASPAGRRRLR